MDQLAGLLLEVDPLQVDPAAARGKIYFQVSSPGQRLLVLGNLVSLRKVRVEIIFPGKDTFSLHPAVQGQGGPDGIFHGAAVQHRKSTRQPQAARAAVGIRFGSEGCAAAAKYF